MPAAPSSGREALGISEVQPTSRAVVSDPRLAVEAALHGLGLVCAPTALVRKHRGLVELQVEGHAVEARKLYAVYPSRRPLPNRVRVAVDWLVRGARA